MPTPIDVDRNLLFVVIALQDDLIDQAQFADVCAGWALRPERSLAEMLIERGWITKQDQDEVERKLERKLKKHRGDVRATLGAVAEIEARDALQVIDNPLVRQSLGGLAPARGHVLVETLVPPASRHDTLRYTFTKVHAEGGLGKIWLAHDTDLNRDVALKEIKGTTAVSPEYWRRFLKEAQITGQLEHPNIVPVYELARRKEDDQPFYTMRFVRGQSLRDAIAEFHRRRAGEPAERLELQRQLLEPFVKVCQAVGYAHSRGVIHRDLKPENVVLGSHGEVVVLDWGLAKVIGEGNEAEQTQEPSITVSAEARFVTTHGQLGTPAYMAPEQVEALPGTINTRTDVYGLGAILFEILTASPPASGPTLGEVFRRIKMGNLPRAREVEPTVPRALEAICIKALARERQDRYPRAEDLAEDVRRWLVDEPVSVYHDPLTVRLLRWGRRHRTLVASLAALLVTAVVGLALGIVFVNNERARTDEQRQIALGQKKFAEEQKQIAVANEAHALRNLRLAQDAADGLLSEVADVDLADIPQMEGVRKRLLEKARTGYAQFMAQKGDDPLVRWGAERSLVRMGDIQALLGENAKAESSYREAITELGALLKQEAANVDFQRDLARALHGLGVVLKDANRFQPAEASLREAIKLRDEISTTPATSPDDLQALADSRYQLGAVLARRGAGKTEEAAYSAALEVQQGLVQQYGDRPEYRTRFVRYRNNLAILQYAAGRPHDAEKTLRETLAFLSPSIDGPAALPGSRWQFARACNNLGKLLLDQRNDEAAEPLNRAHGVLAKLAAEFPAVAQYSQELASVEYNLGLLAQRARHPEQAVAAYKESARLLESLRRRFLETPAIRLNLARAKVAVGEVLAKTEPREARTALGQALDEQSAVLTEFPDVPEYQSTAGRGHFQLGRLLKDPKQVTYDPAEALRHFETAQTLIKQALRSRPDSDTDKRNLVETQQLMTLALIDVGRLAEAAATAEQLPVTLSTDVAVYVRAAALLIKCSDAATSTPEGQRQAEACLTRAVGILHDGVRGGVIRSPKTLLIPDLSRLHDRDDFKKVLDSVSQAPHTG
jgi:serine/threonine protein kinase